MNWFENALAHVKLSKEEFFSIYNLPDAKRAEEEQRLYDHEPTKYGDYMHLLIAYKQFLKEESKE